MGNTCNHPHKPHQARGMCNSCYQRWSYRQNRQYYIDKANRRKKELRQWFVEYKSRQYCTQCGFSDLRALQFHHLGVKEPGFEVSALVAQGYSKDRILEEIAKCEVLCANCHFIEHS